MTTRLALAVLVAAHGLIHLIGAVVAWQIAGVDGFPYRTTVLQGHVDLGAAGTALLGLLWLGACVGFLVAALGLVRRSTWALALTAWLAFGSLVLCVLWLPETAAGVVVNLVILGAAAWLARAGLAPREVTA